MNKPLLASCLLAVAICAVAPGVLGQTPPAPLSPSEVAALDANIEQIKSPDQTARLQAADKIANMGPRAKAAVPALLEMLNDAAEPVDRLAAIMALARIGPEAKPAIPALRQATNDSDVNVKKAAELAIVAIDPPVTAAIEKWLWSPYVMAAVLSLGAGLIALFVLMRRRADAVPEPLWKQKADEAKKARERTDAKGAPAGVAFDPSVEAAPAAAAPAPKATPGNRAMHRARVSRPLPGLAGYVREQDSPESVKRELARAQEELKKISDRQMELDGLLEQDTESNTERIHTLRNSVDQYAAEHYRAKVRVKALEIKMVELLLSDVKTADAELRERSESTLKQKWDDLRTLCETPSKIVYKSDQWVSVPTGPTASISNIRQWLREFDVVLPERKPAEPEESAEPTEPEESAEPAEPDEPGAAEAAGGFDVLEMSETADDPKPSREPDEPTSA